MEDKGIVEEFKWLVITISMNNILYKCLFCIILECQLDSNFLKVVRQVVKPEYTSQGLSSK